MAYDAAETLRALERPSISVPREQTHFFRTVGKLAVWIRKQLNRLPGVDLEAETKTYRGRLLSQQEWMPIQRRMMALAEGADDTQEAAEAIEQAGNEEEVVDLYREYLLKIGIPPSHVLRLPPGPMQEAMENFFDCQSRAAGMTARPDEGSRTEGSPEGGRERPR